MSLRSRACYPHGMFLGVNRYLLPCLLLLIVVPAIAAESSKQTRVRVQGEPRVVWRGGSSGTYADSATATVRNVGKEVAEGVRVELELPGGSVIALSGPSRLEPNQSASYTWDSYQYVVGMGKVIARADCSNCFR